MSITNNINFKSNDRIKQYGKTEDGRLIVGVKDIDNGKYIKSTIPEDNFDEFEKFTNETQDKYEKYLKNHFQKGNQLIYKINICAAAIGGAIGATCMKNSSRAKTFFGTLGGAFAGVIVASATVAGFLVSKLVAFAKMGKTLDLKPYKEENISPTTKNEIETTANNSTEITTK